MNGEKLDLDKRVVLGPEGPVIPIRKVAAALGMKLQIIPSALRLG